MSYIKCEIDNLVLKRDDFFSLDIRELTIPSNDGSSFCNKLPLMGKSGAGKSTLLNLMAAIEWPQEGSISWHFPNYNKPIEWNANGPTAKDARLLRRRHFGYAFQDSTLMPHLTIRDNLFYPLMLQSISEAKGIDQVRKYLGAILLDEEQNDLDNILSRFPHQLSGGQRQRIALVQAMIHRPSVIFADEPTGSLDFVTRKQVMDVLYKWADDPEYKGQRLLVWVTHHEDDPTNANADEYLKINKGTCTWECC